jgi:hypothetical protein
LNYRNCNSFLNFSYYLSNNLFFNYLLYDLRNLNDLLNNSWNDNYLFYNLLNLYDFGHFNHFLNNFLNLDSDLFNSLYNFRNLNNSLFYVLDNLWNLNIMVYNFFNFNDFWLINDKRLSDFDFLYLDNLNSLDDWNLYYILNYFNYFMNHRNIEIFLYLDWNLFYLFDDMSYNFLNFFDSFLNHNFLNYFFNFYNLNFSFYYLNYSVSEFFDFNDSLNYSIDINWFLNNLFHNSML